jgi:hypothetical protein
VLAIKEDLTIYKRGIDSGVNAKRMAIPNRKIGIFANLN